MQDIRIEGTGKISEGEYGTIKVDGFGEITGFVRAETINVDGKLKVQGGASAALLDCDGFLEIYGDAQITTIQVDGSYKNRGALTAETIGCDGAVEVFGNVRSKTVDVDGSMSVKEGNQLEAETITCDGIIQIDGQISADQVKVDGMIQAKEIVGDSIVIHSRMSHLAKLIFRGGSAIELIEATNIDLTGVTAQSVNGHDVKIGPRCHIEHLDCSGTLQIHPTAEVKAITGIYTIVS